MRGRVLEAKLRPIIRSLRADAEVRSEVLTPGVRWARWKEDERRFKIPAPGSASQTQRHAADVVLPAPDLAFQGPKAPLLAPPPGAAVGPEALALRGSRPVSVRQADGCRGQREDGRPSGVS